MFAGLCFVDVVLFLIPAIIVGESVLIVRGRLWRKKYEEYVYTRRKSNRRSKWNKM